VVGCALGAAFCAGVGIGRLTLTIPRPAAAVLAATGLAGAGVGAAPLAGAEVGAPAV